MNTQPSQMEGFTRSSGVIEYIRFWKNRATQSIRSSLTADPGVQKWGSMITMLLGIFHWPSEICQQILLETASASIIPKFVVGF